jgi:hypothetical protein
MQLILLITASKPLARAVRAALVQHFEGREYRVERHDRKTWRVVTAGTDWLEEVGRANTSERCLRLTSRTRTEVQMWVQGFLTALQRGE